MRHMANGRLPIRLPTRDRTDWRRLPTLSKSAEKMKNLKLLAVVLVLAVAGLMVWGLLLGGLADLAYWGTNYMADKHGGLLAIIVVLGVICTVVMMACRTKKQ
jgi:hypothetical protein